MNTDPLKLSKQGLRALSDREFAEQRKKMLDTLAVKRSQGHETGSEELLMKAYEAERKRRAARTV